MSLDRASFITAGEMIVSMIFLLKFWVNFEHKIFYVNMILVNVFIKFFQIPSVKKLNFPRNFPATIKPALVVRYFLEDKKEQKSVWSIKIESLKVSTRKAKYKWNLHEVNS